MCQVAISPANMPIWRYTKTDSGFPSVILTLRISKALKLCGQIMSNKHLSAVIIWRLNSWFNSWHLWFQEAPEIFSHSALLVQESTNISLWFKWSVSGCHAVLYEWKAAHFLACIRASCHVSAVDVMFPARRWWAPSMSVDTRGPSPTNYTNWPECEEMGKRYQSPRVSAEELLAFVQRVPLILIQIKGCVMY